MILKSIKKIEMAQNSLLSLKGKYSTKYLKLAVCSCVCGLGRNILLKFLFLFGSIRLPFQN